MNGREPKKFQNRDRHLCNGILDRALCMEINQKVSFQKRPFNIIFNANVDHPHDGVCVLHK